MKLRLTLEVEYNRNGETTDYLKELLRGIVDHAMGEGLVTGETEATVESYTATVEELPDTSRCHICGGPNH